MAHQNRFELSLTTQDGIKISAHHYRADSLKSKVIIICPGFLMYKESKPFVILSERLANTFDIITIDFRGHGSSTGLFTFSAREYLDLRAAVDYATIHYKFIGVMGFSLGGAAAINEAATNERIDSVMAVSAPTEFERIENRFIDKNVLIRMLRKFEWRMMKMRPGNILLDKPKPIEKVGKISPRPIIFVHGTSDAIIDVQHSKDLFEKAKEPKRLIIIKEGLHAEDLFYGDEFNSFTSLCTEWFTQSKKD